MNSFLKAGTLSLLAVGLVACGSATDEPANASEMAAESPAETLPTQPPAPAPAPAPAAAAPRPAAPAPAPAPAPRPQVPPTPAAAPPPPAQSLAPAPVPARVFVVPEGTVLNFTLIDGLTTETNMPGDTFQASLSDALMIDGVTVIPRNALATGRVLAVDEPGRVQGRARIELAMTEIRVGEAAIPIQTVPFVAEAESTQREDAAKIGVGAGLGAIIGGILGGGGGAAKGAAIGGGAGTGVVLGTRGDQIVYPSESKLEFTLGEPASVTEVN